MRTRGRNIDGYSLSVAVPLPVIEMVMHGKFPHGSITIHVRRRAESLMMMKSLPISLRTARNGLCLNGCRSRGPRNCDGHGVVGDRGDMVMGFVSF